MILLLGDIILILDRSEVFWWYGQVEDSNKKGYFPTTYVSILETQEYIFDDMDLQELHIDRKRHSVLKRRTAIKR